MSNRKSIFFKYFVICSAVILISFVCLGTVLLLVSSRYFIDEKRACWRKHKALALYTQEEMLAQPADWKKSVTDEMMQYSMACNADFILCDSTGAVLVNSSKDPVCSLIIYLSMSLKLFLTIASMFIRISEELSMLYIM